MTREEAIKVLEKYKRYAEGILTDEVLDSIAFDMAIESISTEEEKENGTFVNGDNCNFNCNDSNRTLVDVVRCKDCKHYESDGGALMVCSDTGVVVDDDDFCSYGERRTKHEIEDGEHCRLKLFINKDKYETAYPQGMIEGGDTE